MNSIPSDSIMTGAEEAAVGTYDVEEGELLLRVNGILPAMDFHPFVVRVARDAGVRGWIRHEPSGALIRAVGFENQLVQLVRAIRDDSPASARVRGLEPDLIKADTPAVGEGFVPLVEEPVPMPHSSASLAQVA